MKILILYIITMIYADPFEGMTLITSMNNGSNPRTTHLIDNNQNIINSWSHSTGPASIAYLMPDSTLYLPCKISGQGGGQGGHPCHSERLGRRSHMSLSRRPEHWRQRDSGK